MSDRSFYRFSTSRIPNLNSFLTYKCHLWPKYTHEAYFRRIKKSHVSKRSIKHRNVKKWVSIMLIWAVCTSGLYMVGCNSRLISENSLTPQTVTGALPLIPAKAVSFSMIKHAINSLCRVQSCQTLVRHTDQQIYALESSYNRDLQLFRKIGWL